MARRPATGVIVFSLCLFASSIITAYDFVPEESDLSYRNAALTLSTGSPLSTHILDTTRGRPADNVGIKLHMIKGPANTWTELDQCTTDNDGRCELLENISFNEGTYKLVFATGEYFESRNIETFYPSVEVIFKVKDASEHYHVPLLLNPFSYSTYRGS